MIAARNVTNGSLVATLSAIAVTLVVERNTLSAWADAEATIDDISSVPASSNMVSWEAIPTASRLSGKYPNAARVSNPRSDRTSAWIAAAHRNGTVSSAAIPAILQYDAENQLLVSCGLVVWSITLAVSFNADSAPEATQPRIATRATALIAVEVTPPITFLTTCTGFGSDGIPSHWRLRRPAAGQLAPRAGTSPVSEQALRVL